MSIKSDESPRTAGSDDRFFTPRVSARSGGYTSSGDEGSTGGGGGRGFVSSRSWASDTEYRTSREEPSNSDRGSDGEFDGFHSTREDGHEGGQGGGAMSAHSYSTVEMPFIASEHHPGRSAGGAGRVPFPGQHGQPPFEQQHSGQPGYDGKFAEDQGYYGGGYGQEQPVPRAGSYGMGPTGGAPGPHQSHSHGGHPHYDSKFDEGPRAGGTGYEEHAYQQHGHGPPHGLPHGQGGHQGPPAEVYVNPQDVQDVFSLARHNRTQDVSALLDKGIPVDVRDKHGNTMLCVACQNGLKKMAKLALRRGADINARNVSGQTCQDVSGRVR